MTTRDTLRGIGEAVETAWEAFDHAAALPACVNPAVPILFFGDLDAYLGSRVRVLTVGLNPSLREFPRDEPFRRFPLARRVVAGEPGRYLDALSAYFRTDPYRAWFSSFEPLLNGLGSSYYRGHPSTALHTDICSPVATDPTWSSLGEGARAVLEADGGPLWHTLLEVLQPHVVVLSVARDHLLRVAFEALAGWETIAVFDRTSSGAPRKQPVEISTRWYEIGGELSMFVFGRAAQKPLSLLSTAQKREAGQIALEVWRSER